MESLCKLAQEKGFKAKTVSTSATLKYHLGEGKNLLINDTCDYLLLCEIQKWLREDFKTDVFVLHAKSGYWWTILRILEESFQPRDDIKDMYYNKYEQALIAGIKETLKTI